MNTPVVEIITIGDELLKGSTLNTNAKFAGRQLTHWGFYVQHQCACPDKRSVISSKIQEAIQRSNVLILSGGLGPTPDDVTREAIADFLGVPLLLSTVQMKLIKKLYRHYGKKVPSIVKKEAMFPESSQPMPNRYGIALGFYVQQGKKLIFALPGVPREFEKMLINQVQPVLRKFFKPKLKPQLVVKMVGISEPDVMKLLRKDFFDQPFDFGIYPEPGEVTIRLQAEKASIIHNLRIKVAARLKNFMYALDDTPLTTKVGKLLRSKRRTLALAESCTGGMLSSEVTKPAGASDYYLGGITAYHNHIKSGLLNVSAKILKSKGAVSKEVAISLADHVRKKFNAYYGIGVTGIAGPTGATKQKPIGLVYISVATPQKVRVWKNQFWGDRVQIQTKATKKALEYLWRTIHAKA